MKYAIILPDGAADEPLPQLAGRTPLEAAEIPNMDRVARHGRLGRAVTIPAGFTPGTDVGTLSLLGYDPAVYYSGRAPIEAAARGLTAGPDEIIFRCNFVTILDGRMKDFTAGHILQSEADQLIGDLNRLFADDPGVFHSGISYRNLMIASAAGDMQLKCAPPHDIPDQPIVDNLPRGAGQERVREMMTRAAKMLKDHEVNRVRAEQGKAPVTDIWLWGQGRPTKLEPFAERFGVQGVVITGVDIIRGLAVSLGMKLIEVEGATGYIDTNYAGKGTAAVRALDEYDLVVVHVEAPDEAGHLGDAAEKIKALERIDELVVGPLLEALRRHGEWKMLIAADHPTPVTTTAHDAAPPPFCFAGSGVEAVEKRPYTEQDAIAGGFMVDPGHGLMGRFL
ncbi:MAG: cofactor-independent phosphoglycerate mutase [Phycisphaerae bacterium]|nr:cofactor-independent phosphoglycerate mutase [Phycisphaerae bacterium]